MTTRRFMYKRDKESWQAYLMLLKPLKPGYFSFYSNDEYISEAFHPSINVMSYDTYPKAIEMQGWCGARARPLMSRTQANPGRRYYGCVTALSRRVTDDRSHMFKWVDEDLVDEVNLLGEWCSKLEKNVGLILTEIRDTRNIDVLESVEKSEMANDKNYVRFMLHCCSDVCSCLFYNCLFTSG